MNLPRPTHSWHLFVPKLFTTLREGYSWGDLRADAFAGLTVAIVAIPLAMALGIASGTTPDKGLITAVVAGFLISFLGGSRVQIGGPTGAFVVVVFSIIATHGYDGLVLATLMAGVILVIAGFLRLGTWIKYIPQPVITGFTAGIAVIIFSSQIKDIFGLEIEKVPGDFFEKWEAFWTARDSVNLVAFSVSVGCLALIVLMRKYLPKLPAFLVAIIVGSLVVYSLDLPVETIQSSFGEIPHTLPSPHIPDGITLAHMRELLPSAFTIAFLAGIESLLSAVVADGMIGRRHRSNCELVGQGFANMASAFFGGLPATGAIARTVTNIRSGARSPVAGMFHAAFVLLCMMVFAPLASYIPLAALSSILIVVAWNMSEHDKIRHLMRAPLGEKLVLLVTFVLTVGFDLTLAIEVGVVMAAILFMHEMSEAVEIQTHTHIIEEDQDDITSHEEAQEAMRSKLPEGVEAYRLRGPLFFGVASRLLDALEYLNPAPHVFILRTSLCPMIDSSGESALRTFLERCQKKHIYVIITDIQPIPKEVLTRMKLYGVHSEHYTFAANFKEGVRIAEEKLEKLQAAHRL